MEESIMCTACRVSITSDQRREHYKSDLHRVNLKRKVSGLGPLTQTELVGRIQALQEERQQNGREKQLCQVCSKKFSSKKALENHIKSKRHRDALMKMEMSIVDSDSYVGDGEDGGDEEDVVIEDVDSDDVDNELERRMEEWVDDGMFSGIFDDSWHDSSDRALQHAREKFGLFVPYNEFVNDLDGLIRYLGQKVVVGYACVCCDRGFGSADAARRHMKDVGHCRMGDDWVEEYGEFYRWSDDTGWEQVDDDDDDENVDGDVEEVVEEGMEIVERLDSGGGDDDVGLVIGDKIIGHRSLKRYYGQGIGRNDDLRVAVVANRNAVKELRMIGWKRVDKQVVKAEKNAVKRRQRFQLVVGGKNYYTRKARFKQKMAVFNSGYRA